MATFTELQTRVTLRVIDTPAAVQAEVPKLVNEAVTELQTQHNFFVMKEEKLYTTVLLTRSLGAVPTDWKEWRGKPYYEDDMGETYEMAIGGSKSAIHRRWGLEDEGEPDVLWPEDEDTAGVGVMHVYPLPNGNSDYSDGEYRIVIPYFKYLPVLVAGTDTNWFTVNAEKWITASATAEAFALDWDEKRADYWLERAEKEFDKVILRDKKRWLSTTDTLVPHSGAREPQIVR